MKPKMIFLLFVLIFAGMCALVWYALHAKKSRDPWSLSKGYKVRGLDLSHHNGRIRYDELDSLDFVFLKATEGTTVTDKTFEKHYSEFREKEIAIGVYHFFRFDIDGKVQAKHFLSQIAGKKFQIPLVVDVEQDNNPIVSPEKVVNRLHAFMNEVKKRTGLKPIIYTNGIGYSDFISDDFNDHTLWLSATNTWRPMMTGCTFWQFNTEADLSAITHNVDLNVFRGTREEWEEYLQEHKPFVVSSN